MTNFDTARDALETSLNSSGSAMQEHEKWQQSLEARINSLKASWQSLSQSFLSSDFLKGTLDTVIKLVDGITLLIDKVGTLPTLIGVFAGFKGVTKWLPQLFVTARQVGGIKQLADILPALQLAFPKAAKGATTFGNAIKAMFTAMTAHPIILAITAAIAALTAVFVYQNKKAKELAEKVDELTNSYKQNYNELKKLKNGYDTSNESSMISKYEKLSKGVDNLGRNVSLTADEYLEYQNIVNTIAEQIPSLVTGYDEQGNALLSVKGNVEELTIAYEKLIHAQNQEVLTNAGDIEKNFANTLEKSSGKHWWSDGQGFWAGIWNKHSTLGNLFYKAVDYELKNDTVKGIQNLMNAETDSERKAVLKKLKIDRYSSEEIRDALTSAGVDVGNFENPLKVLEETLKSDPQKVKNIVDNYYSQFAEDVEKQKTIAQAKLSEAFDISSAISGLNYGNIDENLQAVAHQVVNSFDLDFLSDLSENNISVEDWVTNMLDQLNSIGSANSTKIEAAFDLQTQFNGGEISYGEYVDGLKDTGRLIKGLGLDEKVESQLLLSLGLNEKGLVEEYQQLRNRLADDELFDISLDEYEPFLHNLSSEELSVLIDIIPELSESEYKETIDDVKNALRRELIVQGLTFDLNLEVESAGIEALNTALAESVSATGLSSDSISALKGRYSELESQGYDLSSMFEETSNGIHVNREELNKLEKAYASQKLDEVNSDLAEMKVEYDRIGEELKTCSDEAKAGLYNDQLTLAQKISEAATLASQYEGLTSAYNDWLSAEETGQERDMYEKLIEGFENVDDEIKRGWIDDGTIKFLELLTGRTDLAGKSGKQLKEIYDGLDKTIGKSGYSIRDFFTVNEDGDSTNTGVYNFLETVESFEDKLGNVIERKDGNIVGFDFEVAGGDEVIAETLGISEELVQIMLRAADDAGFVISLDGTYRQLADLQKEAKVSANYLKEIGKTDFEFDFNTSNVESLNTQLNEAHKILDDPSFWKDGVFDDTAEGAKQAMEVVSTLQAKLDYLTQDKYGIGLTVEDEEFEEPLTNLQEYGRTIQTLNQLKLNPKVNAEEIEECETRLDELAQEFNELDTEKKLEIGLEIEKGVALTQENLDKLTDEKKIKLGFVDDNGNPLTNVVDVIQNKIESGEVTIPTVLDIQANMDKNIEKLADLAWLNSGFLTTDEEEIIRKKYNIEIEGGDVDDSDVEEKVEKTVHSGGGGKFTLSREANVKIIADTFGVEDVDDLTSKLKGLDDKTIEAVAKVVGKIKVDELRRAIGLLESNEVDAIANAIGKGDVVELSDIIGQLSPKTVDAIANALGYDDVNDLRIAIENLDPKTVEAVANALGITDVESLKAAIDNVHDKDVKVEATTSGENKLSGLKSIIDSIKSKTVTITSWFKKITSGGSTRNDSNGFSDVNGTANVDGTTGRAFKQGNWGTKNSGTALVGELGTETLVRDGRYYTIGDTGAEFIKYKKGDIIFNHKQTEELFTNGRVTSGGGRGRAFAEGTAFSRGSGGIGKVTSRTSAVTADGKIDTKITKKSSKKKAVVTTIIEDESGSGDSSGSSGSSGSTGSGEGTGKVEGTSVGTEKDKKEFEDTIDWIETILDRAERAIDKYEKQANNVYKTWDKRNKALESEIDEVSNTITLYEQAKNQYLSEANSVGLDATYAEKIRNGSLSVEDFEGESDEKLVEKIKNYQDLYNKYLDCIDKINELKEKEASLYAERFNNVQSEYENLLQGFDHTETMLNEYISQSEAKGHIVSKNYYDALIANEEDRISTLKQKQSALITARDEAVANGEFDKYSEEWYNMCAEIDAVTQEIEGANTSIIEWSNNIRDIEWEVFDLIQERISDITDETDFLIELMSNKDLFDDNGKFTEQGAATLGLHGLNYNTYMYQADDYGKEVAEIDKQLAKDPYDQELINRRRELIELQREMILAAGGEKNTIVDLVEEGINLELEALDEKIQKYEEALQSQKDLYDYQRKVEEQTKNIASLQKQLSAYEGDNSEEAKAKIQELRVSLEEAEADLEETEYDKYIADQSALLDNLYAEYELLLNERLDNTNDLIQQVINGVNAVASLSTEQSDSLLAALGSEGTLASALGVEGAIASAIVNAMGENGSIKGILNKEVSAVGTTLSNAMKGIWTTEGTGTNDILASYGSGFQNKQTTTNNTLGDIKSDVARMVDDVDKDAKKKVDEPKTQPSAKADPTKSNSGNNNNEKNDTSGNQKTEKEHYGVALAVWNGNYGWGNGDERKKRLKEKGFDTSKVQSIVNRMGEEGYVHTAAWIEKYYGITDKDLKKYSFNSYASGKKRILDNEYAWTQEQGQEYIVRPSDGAILTPVAKGDSVLTSTATNNIWQMANSPAEFIKDNLNLGTTSVPNNSNVQSNYTQHIDNVVFRMDNVKNYDEMLAQMQRDPNFERLVEAMSIGKLAGKSSLAKGKAIR